MSLMAIHEANARMHKEIKAYKAEIDALKAQRDVAIKHIAEWCVAIQQNGAGWDDWDEYYKKACCRDNALPEIRELLDAAIKKARSDELGVMS